MQQDRKLHRLAQHPHRPPRVAARLHRQVIAPFRDQEIALLKNLAAADRMHRRAVAHRRMRPGRNYRLAPWRDQPAARDHQLVAVDGVQLADAGAQKALIAIGAEGRAELQTVC